jgi:hypothetical protein
LYRTLRRRPFFRLVTTKGDVQWIYAAYRKGAFPEWPDGLSPKEFSARFLEICGGDDDFWILHAPDSRPQEHTHSLIPVGLAVGQYDEHRLFPIVRWFPWASARNRLETSVGFINELRRQFLLLFYIRVAEERFYEHLMRYGIIRRVGKIPNYFDFTESESDAAMVYHSRL